jgi:hypothetical protein
MARPPERCPYGAATSPKVVGDGDTINLLSCGVTIGSAGHLRWSPECLNSVRI